MPDIEQVLREEVMRMSDAYQPAPDLPGRIRTRVRRRTAVRRAALAGAAVVMTIVLVAAVALARGDDRTETIDDPDGTTTTDTTRPAPDSSATTATSTTPTSAPPAEGSTTSTTEGSVTSTSTQGPPSSPTIGPDTPLTRQGIGPIVAGMTVREATMVSGNTITPGEPLGPGSTCNTASIEGADASLILRQSGDPGADPFDAVVQAVDGRDVTEEGIAVGDPLAEVEAAYGTPTRTVDYPYPPGEVANVYVQDAHAYAIVITGTSTVHRVQSGLAEILPVLEGCA